MRYGAVVPAAGISSRMEEFKPMLPMGEESVIQNVVRILREAGVRQIIVVTGYHREALEAHLKQAGVIFVHNERFARTKMFDSIKLGLGALDDSCDRVFITPADVPLVRRETLRKLMVQEGAYVRPLYRGRPGHPVLVDRSVIPALLACSGKEGLRGAVREAKLELREVEVEDEGTVLDMDTPQDYAGLLHRKGERRLRIKNQLVIGTDELFFGPGTAQLLEMIDLTGTITAASEAMHMSYTKAWNMLNQVEEQLGHKVVVRANGGREGGGTSLTERGRWLLDSYRGMQQELKQNADTLLEKYFGRLF